MKKDSHNIITAISVLIIGGVFLLLYFFYIDEKDKSNLNKVNLFGIYITISAFIITIIQLLKISSNYKTYKRTVDDTITFIKNNELVSIISSAKEQILVIKRLFEIEKIDFASSNFNNLYLYLFKLSKSDKIVSYKTELERLSEMMASIESKIFLKEKLNNEEIKNLYNELIKLQGILTETENILKTPNS